MRSSLIIGRPLQIQPAHNFLYSFRIAAKDTCLKLQSVDLVSYPK